MKNCCELSRFLQRSGHWLFQQPSPKSNIFAAQPMRKAASYAAITLAIFVSTCALGLSAEPTKVTQTTKPADRQSPASVDPARKLKNRPVLSAGSGKDLGDFKSGTYTITSAGLQRKYTIDIPAHYNKKKPYRLIFAMHMMGGHMDTMVNNQFYGLKAYAEKDNVP
jgi:hypothetical protein